MEKEEKIEDVKGYHRTCWGMTSEEIIEIFPSTIRKLEKRENYKDSYAAYAIPEVSIGGFDATVEFQMSSVTDRLQQVLVRFAEPALFETGFQALMQMLADKYGTPAIQNGSETDATAIWRFPTTTIELKYLNLPSVWKFLTIRYFASVDDGSDLI
ncbi:MAG: hypothetical protein ACK5ZC_02875 [Pirellulaceae bacterium]|jgi:hypothetical protein